MAIDPNWVRENPEEAAKQIDLLNEMHVDHVRHLWESRGFGGCGEFAEAFDSIERKYRALSEAKLEAMPADLKSRLLVIKMKGDIGRPEAREVMKELAKHSCGAAVFVNTEVDLDSLHIAKWDADQRAAALEEAAKDTVPSMHQMANWLLARAAEERRKGQGRLS